MVNLPELYLFLCKSYIGLNFNKIENKNFSAAIPPCFGFVSWRVIGQIAGNRTKACLGLSDWRKKVNKDGDFPLEGRQVGNLTIFRCGGRGVSIHSPPAPIL